MRKQTTRVSVEGPAIVLVFPYEGQPWGAICPDDSVTEKVLDWIVRVYPDQADQLLEWVEAVQARD